MGTLDILQALFVRLTGSTAIVGIIAFVFWKADNMISKAGRELLEKSINQSISEPERSELQHAMIAYLAGYSSTALPAVKYLANVALLTLASMAILLIVYFTRTAGLYAQLSADRGALELFLRQFLLNGFVVAYTVNYIAFATYSTPLG